MKKLTLSLLSLAAFTAGLFLAGCTSYSMLGEWKGDIDCGTGSVPVEMEWDLEDDGQDAYKGEGKFYWTTDYYYEWNFDIEVTHPKIGMGAVDVELDVELDNCEEIDLGPGDCANVDATWYFKDEEIEGEFGGFFNVEGSNVDCDFLLD
jgi:hypothetical protein